MGGHYQPVKNRGGHGNPHGGRRDVEKNKNGTDHYGDRKFQGRESLLASRISLFVDDFKPKIPDGGWGWLVVLACTFINCVSDGITCCFGLLYIDFLNEFKASNSATAWIGSFYIAVPLVAGPIGSAMVDRYGCKWMTVLGALISTCGFILSTFARNIVVMYVTFGFIGGIGLALCYVTAVVSIAFWFEEKRTLALGLAAAGCGFGTVIYSPLITILSSEYGWRGTVLILAGLFANMVVCGLLMRDPDWVIRQEKERLAAEKSEGDSSNQANPKISEAKFVMERVKTSVDIKNKARFHSAVNLPTYLRDQQEVPLEVLKNLSNDKHLYKIVLENYPNLLRSSSHSDTSPDRLAADASLVTTRVPVRLSMTLKPKTDPNGIEIIEHTELNNHRDSRISREYKPILRKDSKVNFLDRREQNGSLQPLMMRRTSSRAHMQSQSHLYHSYLKNIRIKRDSMGCRGALLNIHKYKLTATSCPDIVRNELIESTPEEQAEEKWYTEFLNVIQDLFSFELFLDLHFFIFSFATILLNIWFSVPFVYLADYMMLCGYTNYDASLVISVIGGTNVAGMVIIGWLGDKIDTCKLHALCLMMSGATICCMKLFTTTYYVLIIAGGAFGLFYASCHSLTPAITAKLVPLDQFAKAYGLSLLCQGIGKLTGPPLAGMLFDMTQSYSQSFFQAALWIAVSGVFVGIIPFTKTRKLCGK